VKLYETMLLLDNQAVRAGWRQAKAAVTEVLTKHGARVATARRFDERRLAYPIKGKKRGTYLLAYYEIDPAGTDGLRRELDLSETVLRYIQIGAESVPEAERELHQAELADDFEVPPPPEDVEPEGADDSAEEAAEEGEGVEVEVEIIEPTEALAPETEEEQE
jgi:small subunit ribosomal protein S6